MAFPGWRVQIFEPTGTFSLFIDITIGYDYRWVLWFNFLNQSTVRQLLTKKQKEASQL